MKNLVSISLFFLSLVGLGLNGCAPNDNSSIVEGACPAISRDGRYLAFQRVEGNNVHLGVKDLATGDVRWIVRGESESMRNENACHPAWGKGGLLAFSYANITNTAYQRFHKDGAKEGYRLRIWNSKDSTSCDLVSGLTRNYNPSFSPDGRQVYFCKQGGMSKRANYDFVRQAIAVVDVDDPSDPLPVIKSAPGHSMCGVHQPVVSPNGKFIAYAELDRQDALWGLKIARLDDPRVRLSLTSGNHAAYAPNWFPDGKYLVYTGFSLGDPEWCVYILNIEDRSTKRLCPGEDACVSPDGKTVFYAREGKVWSIRVGPADFPFSGSPVAEPTLQSEKLLFRGTQAVTNLLFTSANVPKHACTSNIVHFFRYTVDWDGRNENAYLLSSGCAGVGFWSFVLGGWPSAHARETGGRYSACATLADQSLTKGGHVFTVIFSQDSIYHSVDGCPPTERIGNMHVCQCSGKVSVGYFPNGTDGRLTVRNLEIGTGWPKNVPAPLIGREVVK